jgi:hypothetical protein
MAYNTVKIKKYSDVIEEFTAAAAIYPGMLVEQTPAAATLRLHATAGGNAIPMFALEDELQGKGLGDQYASGDKVQVWIPNRGDVVYARIADEATVAIGNYLESNGYGCLRVLVGQAGDSTDVTITNNVVGIALEAAALTSLSTTDSSERETEQYIKVRIV